MIQRKLFILFNIISVSFCLFSIILSFIQNNQHLQQSFSAQAISFINGHLDINAGGDTVFYRGKYYWPQGPFPSIIIMPFVLIFGKGFNQIIMQILLFPLLTFLVYRLTRSFGLNITKSFYLTYAFLFSSIVIGLIVDAGNVYYAQLVAICLLLAIILEFQTKRRWLLLGLLESALISTRPTAGLVILLLIYYASVSKNQRIRNLFFLMTPILICIILLLWFNYLRFNNILDNGYYTNYIGQALIPLRDIGIFNIKHIPTNFYYYFLSTFKAVTNQDHHLSFPYLTFNTWGISFFIVSPFFLYTLKVITAKDRYIKLIWIVCMSSLLLILAYYAPGWVQFGPRYIGDLLPLLFVLLLFYFKKNHLSTFHKSLILVSSIINCLLLLSKVYLLSIGTFSYY